MSISTSAISVPPSLYWDGIDGAWSTFYVQVGSPGQSVRLLPGTSASASDTTVSNATYFRNLAYWLTCNCSGLSVLKGARRRILTSRTATTHAARCSTQRSPLHGLPSDSTTKAFSSSTHITRDFSTLPVTHTMVLIPFRSACLAPVCHR